jgi:hypothetical protein
MFGSDGGQECVAFLLTLLSKLLCRLLRGERLLFVALEHLPLAFYPVAVLIRVAHIGSSAEG